ncbi:MAG: hypothetical protein D3906_02605 [Candidatus Electrothrix sp. AUS1_2]|nr:hypothetical protein [Candidatus Electrothrix sp. AUS1_2]
MALRVIEGVPGSGKTFYAVWHLAMNYFKKVPGYTRLQTFFYFLLPFLRPPVEQKYVLNRDCLIITNIDNFHPEHVDLKTEIDKAGRLAREALLNDESLSDRERNNLLGGLDPVAEFFSYDYQELYKEGKPQLVYVIDEAQVFFRKGQEKALKEKEVFRYFEYHRHWGQDIYLVTQNIKKLPSDIVYLPEYTVSAVPRVRSIGFGFKYLWMASGECIKTEVRRPDPAVFALYKSMDVAEQEKISNPVFKTVGLILAACSIILYYGYSSVTNRFLPEDRASASVSSSSGSVSASSVPVSAVSPIPDPSVPALLPESDPPPPEKRYVVFVPLSSITRPSRSGKHIEYLYVWRGALIPRSAFPHKTLYMAGQRYAVLDYDLFDFIFSDGDDRPRDFIVQVASPVEGGSTGSGAGERSRAERLERSERSETAPRTERPLKKAV